MADGLDLGKVERVIAAMMRGINGGDASIAEVYMIAATFYLTVRVETLVATADPEVLENTRAGMRAFAAHLLALADAPTREAFLEMASRDSIRQKFQYGDNVPVVG